MFGLLFVLVALALVVFAVAALFLIVYVAGASGRRAQRHPGPPVGPTR